MVQIYTCAPKLWYNPKLKEVMLLYEWYSDKCHSCSHYNVVYDICTKHDCNYEYLFEKFMRKEDKNSVSEESESCCESKN